MDIRNFKFTRFSAILFIITTISCDKIDYTEDLIFTHKSKFLYKTEKVFCQADPGNELFFKTFNYDKYGNLTEEITYRNDIQNMKTKSSFNSNNQPVTDSIFNFIENKWEINYYFKYNYSNNHLEEKQKYDADGNFTHKTIYKYKASKPEWEEFYYFTGGAWKFQYAHKFEYSRNGQLIKKISYQDESKETAYDQFIYTYSNGELSTEKRILVTGKTGFFREYFYTREGFIDEVIDDGNTVEKNFYEKSKLSEKQTWYFGIDPGFSPCNGNYIYKYEY